MKKRAPDCPLCVKAREMGQRFKVDPATHRVSISTRMMGKDGKSVIIPTSYIGCRKHVDDLVARQDKILAPGNWQRLINECWKTATRLPSREGATLIVTPGLGIIDRKQKL